MDVDVAIFGGGVAGLWLLDAITRAGRSALLLEANGLGSGQTVASQGILHGGFRYALRGRATASAKNVREIPARWRESLAGLQSPDLSRVRIRSQNCFVWWTGAWTSYAGYLGAKLLLGWGSATRVAAASRPIPLRDQTGLVVKIPDQIIAPASLMQCLASPHTNRIRAVRAEGTTFLVNASRNVDKLSVICRETHREVTIRPRAVCFVAGEGNGSLRAAVGLDCDAMQTRPLHMVLVRGDLPELNAHCADRLNERPRVTITTDRDSEGRTVWQVGGVLAEDGVDVAEAELLRRAQRELSFLLPAVSFRTAEWSTYRVNRAEGKLPSGKKPDNVCVRRDGNIITGWPTKLVLAPLLADAIMRHVDEILVGIEPAGSTDYAAWPQKERPTVAAPPWEETREWRSTE